MTVITPAELKRLRSTELIAAVEDVDPEFVVQIPSSYLSYILEHCEQRPGTRVFPVTREEEGVGIAAGLALTGRRTLLVMQDNGLGNALTALTTFPAAYHVPLVMLVARRGGLNEFNPMIHVFCERVDAITDAAGLHSFSLDSRVPLDFWRPTLAKAFHLATITHRPIIVYCNLMGE